MMFNEATQGQECMSMDQFNMIYEMAYEKEFGGRGGERGGRGGERGGRGRGWDESDGDHSDGDHWEGERGGRGGRGEMGGSLDHHLDNLRMAIEEEVRMRVEQ